ncbi:MAG: hypothetical protein NTY38_28360, partial [Acidobacteria bacterium]|nr:hypothetical protein [Acidobacteriota bacterium]
YDMQFKLYDLPGAGIGIQQGGTVANKSVQVVSGVFSVTLDFGASVFPGSPRFIEVSERPGGSTDPYNVLAPRQSVSPAPYAIYSGSAGTVASGSVTATQLDTGGVQPAPGQFLSYDGWKFTWSDPGVAAGSIWSLSGTDTYYTAGKVGIGTTSPQTKLHVVGDAIRFENRGKALDITAGTLTDITARNTSLVLQSLGSGGDNNVIVNPFPNSGTFPNGNVGVGTFSPQHKLSIEGGPTWTASGWHGAVAL